MNNFHKTCLCLSVSLMLMASCKKDDNSNNNTTPQTGSIIGTWMSTAITSDKPYEWESGVVGTDGFTYHSACASNDFITFTQGANTMTGTGVVYDDCAKANGNFSWTLTNNLLTTGTAGDKTIERLDASVLIYSVKAVVNGDNVKLTYQFKKK